MTTVGVRTADRLNAVLLPTAAAIVAAGEAIAGVLDAPTWVYVVIPVVTLAVTAATLLVQQRQKEAQAETDRISALAAEVRWPLPTLADLDPGDVGVKESRIAREIGADHQYAPRDKDDDIRRGLEASRLVLIVGESGAGKSRSALEAARWFDEGRHARRLLPTKVVLRKEGGSLAKALQRGLVSHLGGETVLLWLDDLERHVGAGGFTLDVLAELEAGGVDCRALATLRSQERERILRDDELSRPGREIINWDRTALVELDRRLTPGEKAAAFSLYRDKRVRGALERQGLGEFLVAGHELVHRFRDSRATCPEGGALVAAAIDWRRAGLRRPIPGSALKVLHPHYFERFGVEAGSAAERYEEAVRWAQEPIYATARLLSARETGYLADDYVVDFIQRNRTDPVPDEVWNQILGLVDDAIERVDVGLAAYVEGQPTIAADAWSAAVDSGDTHAAARAAFNLGVLMREQRDPRSAAAFRRAMAFGHSETGSAALALGLLLRDRNPKAAAAALREAMAFPDTEARAALALGLLLRGDDRSEAARALRQAAGSQDAEAAAGAALALGRLLLRDNDRVGAAEAFRQAAASGHPKWGREATAALARLEVTQRDHS